MPVLLAVAYALGWLLAGALRLAWWLLRALWWVTWRVVVLAAALLLLAFSRSLAWRLAVLGLGAALSGRLGGGRWGRRGADTGHRTPSGGAAERPPVKVQLKALSAQTIATGRYADTDWLCYGLLARGVITLLAADAKAGKTELLFGIIRACFAGLDFCGLATKPMRVLVLSEQAPSTLAPFIRRWGFYTEPTGRLDALRQAHLPPKGSPGHAVRIVSWAQLYEGKTGDQRPTWADVAPAGIALARRWGADCLVVDTLGRWAVGEDGSINSGASMLRAIGALHEAAERGLSVLINHHNSRAGNVLGSVSIEGEVDIILRLSKAPREGEDADLTTRRQLKGSGRYQEATPGVLLVRLCRVVDPAPGEPTARYEADGPPLRALPPPSPPTRTPPPSEKPLAPQQRRVLAALQARALPGATVAELGRETGLSRQRVDEALKALCARSVAFPRGTVRVAGGGTPAARYVATAALLTMRTDSPTETTEKEPGGD